MKTTEPLPLTELAPLALLYHENSKLSQANRNYLAESVGEFSMDRDVVQRSLTAFKTYPGAARIALPPKRTLPMPRESLAAVLARRRSVRVHDTRQLEFRTLAALLEHAGGITGQLPLPDDPHIVQSLRATPSGGALYPVEIYCAAFEIAGLEPGIYHYHPHDRCLEIVREGMTRSSLEPLVLKMEGRLDARALLVLTGRWELPLMKYRERGYRVLLLDAGHLAQNLLLMATALELGACPVAGFLDDALGRELSLNGAREPVLYLLTLG